VVLGGARVRAIGVGVVGVMTALGCRDRPDDAELDRLRREAVAANEAARSAAQLAAPTSDEPGYTLTISGQIARPSAMLSWTDLQRLGQTHVQTIDIQNPDKKTPTDFRGLLVRDVLDRFAAAPDATEATVIAIDGFRATVQIADARAYRMLLSIEADGAPIPRSSGGPIYLVHPFTENGPELRQKYPDRFWSFYVTHLVVGTEAPRLAITSRIRGEHVLGPAELAKLPPSTLDVPVSWKVEWPSGTVHIRGVKLTDALSSVGVTLDPDDEIIIRGKAPIDADPKKPIRIPASELGRCRPLLALQWGPEEKPITARQGGPIALALMPCGDAYKDAWVTFVETIEVIER